MSDSKASGLRVEKALDRFDQEFQRASEGILKNFQRIGTAFQRTLKEITSFTTKTVADAEESLRKDSKKRRKRKDNDPNRPRKPPTGYLLFIADRRPTVAAAHPEMKATEVMKLVAGDWQKLDDKKKEEYKAEARKKQEEYRQEMDEYQNKRRRVEEAGENGDDEDVDDEGEEDYDDDVLDEDDEDGESKKKDGKKKNAVSSSAPTGGFMRLLMTDGRQCLWHCDASVYCSGFGRWLGCKR